MSDPGISHEELIALEPASQAYFAADRVKVGPKKITLLSKHGTIAIRFERGITHYGKNHTKPDFQIQTEEIEPVVARCSLGHDHETGKTERTFGRIQLSWEQAETLMEWFQSGTWREVRDRVAAAKQEKPETWKKQ